MERVLPCTIRPNRWDLGTPGIYWGYTGNISGNSWVNQPLYFELVAALQPCWWLVWRFYCPIDILHWELLSIMGIPFWTRPYKGTTDTHTLQLSSWSPVCWTNGDLTALGACYKELTLEQKREHWEIKCWLACYFYDHITYPLVN
jgi:hypothetical protein